MAFNPLVQGAPWIPLPTGTAARHPGNTRSSRGTSIPLVQGTPGDPGYASVHPAHPAGPWFTGSP